MKQTKNTGQRVLLRRQWLRAALVSIAGGAARAAPSRSTLSPQEFRKQLDGPICSVPTVYRGDFSLDHEGFRNVLETGVKAGCRVFTLTAGNNQYDRLTYEEIKQLTRTFVEAVAGRGLTIAATGQWWTGQAVDYARYAASLGADALQVQVPAYGDEALLVGHFRQIAAAGPPSIVLHGQVALPLLERLTALDAVSAYKEEYPPMYSREVFARYGRRLNIFAGGQKGSFLMYQPYGMHAYYSTFSTFAPEVTRRFWTAVRKRDWEAAGNIVLRYDVPFFSKWSHPFWRGTLECFRIAKRWVRPPEQSLTDQEMGGVGSFFHELGLMK